MEEPSSTDSIRNLSTKWSLAADDKLLNLLQHTHQKILSKCQDATSKLEEMALALDDASINLQNVNNKFMALSNSQFIESRVYDDDSEMVEQTILKEASTPSQTDELTIIKNSLSILDRVHEITEIVDDSDSDSDTEISVVLKPKDMYSHRPLPYIIGTQSWKNKWHAGLILEDSDTDSSTSKQEHIDVYSESDTDNEDNKNIDDHTISESGSFTSEQEATTTINKQQQTQQESKQTPADIAAELARRLAGPVQVIPQEEDKYIPPPIKKVYKPEKPVISTIFSDEPPPLDNYVEESSSEDEDIFAEINKHQPYQQRNPNQSNLSDDLFGFNKQADREGDIFSDITSHVNEAKQNTPLFAKESEPQSFEPKKETPNNNIIEKQEETSSKKPIGGISLFGSNKGAESIGAAILSRNKRKSSSSDEQSENDSNVNRNVQEKSKTTPSFVETPKFIPKIVENDKLSPKVVEKPRNMDEVDDKTSKDNDIFDDLFTKPKEKKTQNTSKDVKSNKITVSEQRNVKDLFKDDLFDDIDDIFTSNVTKEAKQRSIFDDDDDDLFNDIAEPKTMKQATSKNDRKNIFDSDDELFSDIKPKNENKTQIDSTITKKSQVTTNQSQNYTEDSPIVNNNLIKNIQASQNFVKPTEIIKESIDEKQNLSKIGITKQTDKGAKIKSIFDSDSDDDIFGNIKISKSTENNKNKIDDTHLETKPNSNFVEEKSKVISPSLFDDEDNELFASTKHDKGLNKGLDKAEKHENFPSNDKIEQVLSTNSKDFDFDAIIEEEPKNHEISSTLDNCEDNVDKPETIIESKEIPKEDNNHEIKSVITDNSDKNSFVNSFHDQKIVENIPEVVKSNQNSDIHDFSTKTKSDENQIGVDVTKRSIKVVNIEKQEKRDPDIEKIRSKVENQSNDIITKKEVDVPEKVEEKEDLFSVLKSPISNVFDDIFSEPPEFEKPVEPKKSKNVNALFDDDSDDEALFFKKDDVITDEKPEIFTSNANFDLFVNEPPTIDVDFIQKNVREDVLRNIPENIEYEIPKTANLTSNIIEKITSNQDITFLVGTDAKDDKHIEVPESQSDLFGDEFEKDLLSKEVKTKINEKNTISEKISDSDDELFSNITKSSQNNKNLEEKFEKPDEYEGSPKRDDDTKKIGKLNTKNFNINVNALMPGASPKKMPKENRTEPDIQSKTVKQSNETEREVIDSKKEIVSTTRSIAEIPIKTVNQSDDVTDNSIIIGIKKEMESKKSVDFKSQSELVLDNNASKQRPRIQVKRRPSTRKARHEAARKSGIDFGNDKNSNFDEPNLEADINKPIFDEFANKVENTTDLNEKVNTTNPKNTVSSEEVNKNTNSSEKIDTNKRSTTKIVYILNDEDIFNTNNTKTSNLDTKSVENIAPIQTLGNTYKKQEDPMEISKESTKSSLFDDSDEELFKPKEKPTKKANIFESDSEDELFFGKKEKEKVKKEQKNREKIKESLFSEDDDDLFGVKNEKIESIQKAMPSTSKDTKISTQPVFNDPLSLLDED